MDLGTVDQGQNIQNRQENFLTHPKTHIFQHNERYRELG